MVWVVIHPQSKRRQLSIAKFGFMRRLHATNEAGQGTGAHLARRIQISSHEVGALATADLFFAGGQRDQTRGNLTGVHGPLCTSMSSNIPEMGIVFCTTPASVVAIIAGEVCWLFGAVA
jgi:hypothetical protein